MTPTSRRSVPRQAVAFGLILCAALSAAQTPPPQNRALAVVVVIDKSGSSSTGLMNMAKEGAKAALAHMREKDLFAVMAFNYLPNLGEIPEAFRIETEQVIWNSLQ